MPTDLRSISAVKDKIIYKSTGAPGDEESGDEESGDEESQDNKDIALRHLLSLPQGRPERQLKELLEETDEFLDVTMSLIYQGKVRPLSTELNPLQTKESQIKFILDRVYLLLQGGFNKQHFKTDDFLEQYFNFLPALKKEIIDVDDLFRIVRATLEHKIFPLSLYVFLRLNQENTEENTANFIITHKLNNVIPEPRLLELLYKINFKENSLTIEDWSIFFKQGRIDPLDLEALINLNTKEISFAKTILYTEPNTDLKIAVQAATKLETQEQQDLYLQFIGRNILPDNVLYAINTFETQKQQNFYLKLISVGFSHSNVLSAVTTFETQEQQNFYLKLISGGFSHSDALSAVNTFETQQIQDFFGSIVPEHTKKFIELIQRQYLPIEQLQNSISSFQEAAETNQNLFLELLYKRISFEECQTILDLSITLQTEEQKQFFGYCMEAIYHDPNSCYHDINIEAANNILEYAHNIQTPQDLESFKKVTNIKDINTVAFFHGIHTVLQVISTALDVINSLTAEQLDSYIYLRTHDVKHASALGASKILLGKQLFVFQDLYDPNKDLYGFYDNFLELNPAFKNALPLSEEESARYEIVRKDHPRMGWHEALQAAKLTETQFNFALDLLKETQLPLLYKNQKVVDIVAQLKTTHQQHMFKQLEPYSLGPKYEDTVEKRILIAKVADKILPPGNILTLMSYSLTYSLTHRDEIATFLNRITGGYIEDYIPDRAQDLFYGPHLSSFATLTGILSLMLNPSAHSASLAGYAFARTLKESGTLNPEDHKGSYFETHVHFLNKGLDLLPVVTPFFAASGYAAAKGYAIFRIIPMITPYSIIPIGTIAVMSFSHYYDEHSIMNAVLEGAADSLRMTYLLTTVHAANIFCGTSTSNVEMASAITIGVTALSSAFNIFYKYSDFSDYIPFVSDYISDTFDEVVAGAFDIYSGLTVENDNINQEIPSDLSYSVNHEADTLPTQGDSQEVTDNQ
ncbi:MAG: hypothetical protein K0T99_00690 [Alphaproteobacteria bacterium]|nr:hypothetical protein [Alphaproteobacteria bacterium]